MIKGGSFSGVDHPLPNHQSKGYLGGGFDWGFVPEDKISGGWKALKGDKIEVWKTDDGKQFVELNANAANNGIEQKVNGIQPGTYVLTWRDMGRESANADGSNYGVSVFTKKKTQDTANNGKNAGALEGRTDILKPPYETAGKWGDWKTKVVVFTVSAEDLKNNNLWIAFKPRDEARTYGALIDDVIIFPLGVMPDVLPVNSGFGEGRVDSNGFAIPDCDDPGHSLKAQRDHLDGKWKAGDFVTEKLHHGFFGLKPGTLTYSSTTGAVVKIRKLDKDDPDTQRKQSGQVRLYAISGPKGSKQEKAIDLYNPDTLQAYDIGNLYQDTNDVVDYYMEGVKPGKITLEFSYQKDDMAFKFEQEFLVATRQTSKKWMDEIRYQIRLQTNKSIDLDNYLPATGWKPKKTFVWHTGEVAAIYNYYGQLFQEHPDELDWMGAAKMVGGAVWAGLSDGQHDSGPTKELMGGQILIYSDLAWQHRAYVASGIWALTWVSEHDNNPANGVSGTGSLEIDNWQRIDFGIQNKNRLATKDGTTRLVTREQSEIIVPMWDDLEAHRSWILSVMSDYAKNPVDPDSPLFKAVILELDPQHKKLSGLISQYESRRAFAFESPKHSVFPIWWGDASTAGGQTLDKNARIALTKISIEKWALPFSVFGSVYNP